LREDVELVGRGKFCSVRLSDTSLQEAHFVLSRDGRLNASTPRCRVEVDGEVVLSAAVRDGSRVKVGSTGLEISGLAASAPAE